MHRGKSTVCRHISRVKLLDGGTGEELFRRGMVDDRKIWSANALVHEENHDLLVQVHQSYLNAGSDFITCNNYGVTPGVGFKEEDIVKYCTVAGQLAQRARKSSQKGTAASICGSLPPLVESYRPDKVLPYEEGIRMYSVIASALRPYVDIYLAETLSSTNEAKMAMIGAEGYEKPVMVSFTLNSRGQIRSGESVTDAINELIHFICTHDNHPELVGVLFNCSEPESISKALQEISNDSDLMDHLVQRNMQLGAYANRLTAIPDNWALAENPEPQETRKDLDIKEYNDFASQWIQMGASLIGGCCGIGPEYIQSLDEMLRYQGLRKYEDNK
jgi:S-methylmethionine-dependent homocysteine/selenocysteine methylase